LRHGGRLPGDREGLPERREHEQKDDDAATHGAAV
jgi:hypothetical protein